MKIGVLALQGAVREHMRHIEWSGHEAVEVKHVATLNDIDGLIIPGGESTTLRRLMDLYGFKEALLSSDLPIFGTCAGLIVLADDIDHEAGYLRVLDVKVSRNSFGRQVDSFETTLSVKGLEMPIEGVFIRAPEIIAVGNDVEVLATIEASRIVAVRNHRCLGVAFHPELTDDPSLTRYFIEKIVKQKEVG